MMCNTVGDFAYFAMGIKASGCRIKVNDVVCIHMTYTFAGTTVYANGMWIVSMSFTEC